MEIHQRLYTPTAQFSTNLVAITSRKITDPDYVSLFLKALEHSLENPWGCSWQSLSNRTLKTPVQTIDAVQKGQHLLTVFNGRLSLKHLLTDPSSWQYTNTRINREQIDRFPDEQIAGVFDHILHLARKLTKSTIAPR